MTKYRLIASDLDGTLLDGKMNVSAENEAAIKKISELGTDFALTSGRTLSEIPPFILGNPNIRYITYSNGSAIYDKVLRRDVVANRISTDSVNRALDVLQDYDLLLAAHIDGQAIMDESLINIDHSYYQINEYYHKLFLKYHGVKNFVELLQSSAGVESFVLFFHSDEELEECKRRLEGIEGVIVTSSIEHNLELCSGKASKGAALAELLKILGLKKEEIISVGDNLNDVSMFEVAGLSLCTANGNADAKAAADAIICSNEEHIAEYILKNYIEA